MHSRVRSGQSRWRTGSTSMSAPAATVRWQSVSWKMGRVHFGRVLSGSEEQCVCRRPLEGVLATKVFELGLVLRIAKEWQLCGGDVTRHGRGHQTAQRGDLGIGWRHWSERGGMSSMEEWQTLLYILDEIASFFMCLTTTR